MRRSRVLPVVLCLAGFLCIDCRDAAAQPRLKNLRRGANAGQRPTADATTRPAKKLTKADIPPGLSPELKALLEATLSDDSGEERRAFGELGAMGAGAVPAVPFLIRIWRGERGGGIAPEFDALIALDKIGEKAAAEMIAATKQASEEDRPKLIKGLGWCDTWQIREAVLSYLNDAKPTIRRAAVDSLYRCDDPRVVAPLIRSLSDSDAGVRKAAISHFNEWPAKESFEPMLRLVKDPDPTVREVVIGPLWSLDKARLVPVLIEIVENAGEVDDVRRKAVFYLGLSGDLRAVAPLLAAFTNVYSSVIVRCWEADALGRLGDRRAVGPLTDVVKNTLESTPVRAAAAHALTDCADPGSLEVLRRIAAEEADPALRFWGAMGTAKLTGGAIEDERIVTAIQDYSDLGDGVDENGPEKQLYLKMIADKGTTEAVRAAARKLLPAR